MPMHGNNLSLRSRNRCSSQLASVIALALLLTFSGCGKKAKVHSPSKAPAAKTTRPASATTGKEARGPVPVKGQQPAPTPGGQDQKGVQVTQSSSTPAAYPLVVTGPPIRIGLTEKERCPDLCAGGILPAGADPRSHKAAVQR